MTGFDIFSAVGNIGEDLLEESEEASERGTRFAPAAVFGRVKRFGTSHMPMLAAAACLALFAFGLRHIYYDSGIEQPVPSDGLNSITTYSAPSFSDLVSDTTETTAVTAETEVTETTETASAETYTETQSETEFSDTAAAVTTYAETTSTADTEKTSRKTTRKETVTAAATEETQEPFITETEAPEYDESIYYPFFPWETGIPEIGTETAFPPKPPVTGSVTTNHYDASVEGDDEAVDEDDDDDVDNTTEVTPAYIFLDYGGKQYTRTGESFERSELTFLAVGEIYNALPNGQREGISCEIYKINDMSENYMLAVSVNGDDYAGFRNFSYKPNSLSEYAADTNFLNENYFTTVRADTADGLGYTVYSLPDLRQALERLILSVPDAAAIDYDMPTDVRKYVVHSGYYARATVCENGYIFIGGETYYIGAEYAAAFISYIENNSEKTEFSYSSSVPNEDVIDDVIEPN